MGGEALVKLNAFHFRGRHQKGLAEGDRRPKGNAKLRPTQGLHPPRPLSA